MNGARFPGVWRLGLHLIIFCFFNLLIPLRKILKRANHMLPEPKIASSNSTSQKYLDLNYNQRKHSKAANPHFKEAGTSMMIVYLTNHFSPA